MSGTVYICPDMVKRRHSNSGGDGRRRGQLLRRLPDLREILRGSLVERYRRCGRANCRCARKGDPGHGPAWYLMVTVGPGKTAQVYVPKQQKERVEDWIENFRITRETLERMSTVNRRLLKEGKLFADD